MERVSEELKESQMRVCRVLTQSRATQRYSHGRNIDKDALVGRVVELASRNSRYSYRRAKALLKSKRWRVNHTRIQRIWKG